MSIAVRNVVGQAACFLDKQIVPGKPLNTRAQRLAIRRSVFCWAAGSNYDSSAATETLAETRSSSQSVLDSWAAPQVRFTNFLLHFHMQLISLGLWYI